MDNVEPLRSAARTWIAIAFAAALAGAVAAVACGGDTSSTTTGQTCDKGQASCGGTCIDTTHDRNNCGGCGNACDPSRVCSRSTCTDICAAPEQLCVPADPDAGAYCANVTTDNANCGACGTACGGEEACIGGQCVSQCAQGQTSCPAADGAPAYCANVQTDNANCGACGTACNPQEVCSAGKCASQCVAGQKFCAGVDGGPAYCADTQTDNANCGVCGKSCGVQQQCSGGVCQPACTQNQTLCVTDAGADAGPDAGGPYCTDLKTDNANCGACGSPCPPQDVCTNGACQPPTCLNTQTLCNADAGVDSGGPYCASLMTDNANCGTCGNVCPIAKPWCVSGVCYAIDAGPG
jgi:hypothetical protein